jgi:uncharacterized protein YjlB
MSDAPPQTLLLDPGETMPNSRLPVLIYRGEAVGFEAMFGANGWVGIWRDGVYDFDHYHSNAHEVLGIEAGRATLQLGGTEGQTVEVSMGDVIVLPAGTGHRRISRSADFLVVGAYPRGQQNYDLCRDRTPEAELRIVKVAMPESDPVRGPNGPLPTLWI